MASKILSLDALAERLRELKKSGKRIVHCHGVFDLIHIGHIKHLEAARTYGDVLVVTITPDRFVNKGPHRPAFPEPLRAEALAAPVCVDFVAINQWPTAVETIRLLKPDVFVKGAVHENGPRDHTGAINLEEEVVKAEGGRLVLTDEETFSATTLINRHLSLLPAEVRTFLDRFSGQHSEEEVIEAIHAIRGLKILTIGETIIDEYQFCDVMAKANKDPILAARYKYGEKYAGGVLGIANHLAGFCDHVGLLSLLGEQDSQLDFINTHLNSSVHAHFIRKPGAPTIVKRRFLEEYTSTKLFEVYLMTYDRLEPEEDEAFCQKLEKLLPQYDVAIVADYGHGLMTDRAINLLCTKAKFLAVNAQTNAGNRGFNMISRYPRADFISIDEPEARLETRDPKADLRALIKIIAAKTKCGRLLVTMGRKGTLCYDAAMDAYFEVPAFAAKVVDRIGAGDAVLALAAPCAMLNLPLDVVGFVGNVAGAEACGIMGNKSALDVACFLRHISSLLK